MPIVEAAVFTAGCIVIHAFRARPERLTEGLAFASIVLLVLVLIGSVAQIAPPASDDAAPIYIAAAQ